VDSVVSKGGKFLVGVLVALFLVANTVLLSSMGSLYVMLAIQAVCFWIALRPDDNLDPSGLRACIVPIILMYALLAGNFALAVAMAR